MGDIRRKYKLLSGWLLSLILLIVACSACTKTVVKRVPKAFVDTVYIDTAATRNWGEGPSKVVILDPIVDSLSVIWRENEEVQGPEFIACMDAERVSATIYNAGLPISVQFWQVIGFEIQNLPSTRKSSAVPDCNGYPGILHSHPILPHTEGPFKGRPGITCHRSNEDRKLFWQYGREFSVIFCGPNDYRWYTRNGEQGGQGYGHISWSQLYLEKLSTH